MASKPFGSYKKTKETRSACFFCFSGEDAEPRFNKRGSKKPSEAQGDLRPELMQGAKRVAVLLPHPKIDKVQQESCRFYLLHIHYLSENGYFLLNSSPFIKKSIETL